MGRLLVVLALVLGGCSLLPKGEVETRYMLGSVPPAGLGQGVMAVDPSRTLRIVKPEVPMAYRDSKLVLLKDGQQTYYAGKAWEAPLPDLLAAALGRDLPGQVPGWAVSGDTGGPHTAYDLQTEVHTFATVTDGSGSAVVMRMDVRLVDNQTRKLLKVLPYDYRAKLDGLTMEDTLGAYQKGWSELVRDVAGMVQSEAR